MNAKSLGKLKPPKEYRFRIHNNLLEHKGSYRNSQNCHGADGLSQNFQPWSPSV